MAGAVQRAVEAGRGLTGELRVAFVGESTAPVLPRAVSFFTERHPECVVHVHEAPLATTRSRLHDGSSTCSSRRTPSTAWRTPPILRGPVWLAGNATARVREFVRAAADAADRAGE